MSGARATKNDFGNELRNAAARVAADPSSLEAEIAKLSPAMTAARPQASMSDVTQALARLSDDFANLQSQVATVDEIRSLAEAITSSKDVLAGILSALQEQNRTMAAPKTIVLDASGKPVGLKVGD